MRTYVVATAIVVARTAVAHAGGHLVSTGHSSGGSSLHGDFSGSSLVSTAPVSGTASSSNGFSSAGFSTSGFRTTGFSSTGFEGSDFGGDDFHFGGMSELSSFSPESWRASLRVALSSLQPKDVAVPQVPVAAPRCCMECTERSSAPAEPHGEARHTAKPVIIEVTPSDALPRVWVVPGPVDIGHRTSPR
jgi:hypothetical protein